jgi:hypothetical protein
VAAVELESPVDAAWIRLQFVEEGVVSLGDAALDGQEIMGAGDGKDRGEAEGNRCGQNPSKGKGRTAGKEGRELPDLPG